jgi:cytochrome b561
VSRHTCLTRVLHWLTAAFVFAAILAGFTAVHALGDFNTVAKLHKTLGVVVLVLVVIRVVNRLTHRAPPLPDSVGRAERIAVLASEIGLYLMLLAQPIIGWATVSASGAPVVLWGGLRLARIAPADTELYVVLRTTHDVLAWALVVLIAAHISAVLLHTIVLRDRMLSRMTFGR